MALVQSNAILEQAFTRLKRSVSLADACTFQSSELQEVRAAAEEIERSQRERGSVRNLKRIRPWLETLDTYSKAIEVLCNGTPYLPWIWVCLHHCPLEIQLTWTRHLLS